MFEKLKTHMKENNSSKQPPRGQKHWSKNHSFPIHAQKKTDIEHKIFETQSTNAAHTARQANPNVTST